MGLRSFIDQANTHNKKWEEQKMWESHQRETSQLSNAPITKERTSVFSFIFNLLEYLSNKDRGELYIEKNSGIEYVCS